MDSFERAAAWAGTARLIFPRRPPAGFFEGTGGEPRFRIRDYDSMPPFLMSVVSEGDHWLFVSSTGALTAGRRDPDHALFPYVTDDRIHAAADATGSKTVVRAAVDGRTYLWEPFSPRYAGVYRIMRTISKSAYGNEVEFEELNEDLGLKFAYSWTTSWKYGFMRRARLSNEGAAEARIELLDGLVDIMPAELTRRFQADFSTLADGYRDSEIVSAGASLVALYRLSSVPTDRAEPCEALRANIVWSEGLPAPGGKRVHLKADCIDDFRAGREAVPTPRLRGRRGAYLERSSFALAAGESRGWMTVADVGRDAVEIHALMNELASGAITESVEADAANGTASLRRIVAAVDGLQVTGDDLSAWRHYSNALFNAMRGGFPPGGYEIPVREFASFVSRASVATASRHSDWLKTLPIDIRRDELARRARMTGDPDLERLAREYLPLAFSRRHGDPSRPWNSFSIATKDAQGRRLLGYEGNWRDIFQNWEALSLSYPGFLDGMIFKFLDASTADGYNPYRITSDGLEWEVSDLSDAWSFIGYWGDHQAAYLLRLLEASSRYRPGELAELLGRRLFTYAQVPYRIKDYDSLVANPKDSVEFDARLHGWLLERSRVEGEDGKLLQDAEGAPYRACLAEKLLVPMLAKLSNFVPDGGIWMNTQRPEWNDANNALVGNGLSVVTLCYLRSLAAFCRDLFAETDADLEISVEVSRLRKRIGEALRSSRPRCGEARAPSERRSLMDKLGRAGSDYRRALYDGGLSGVTEMVAGCELADFCALVLEHIDHSLKGNLRPDGLYHAYNLLSLDDGRASLRRLPAMLEGQVAILSSGILSTQESASLLETMRASALFRPDQGSYMLYPDRELPRFLEKNRIKPEAAASSRLLTTLARDGNCEIAKRDLDGSFRFNADFHNARDLAKALDALASSVPATEASHLAEEERGLLLELYEGTFDHHSFTGRSGTFYKYEGLGSIYWHMVSKLLVAVGECIARAKLASVEPETLSRIDAAYREIREGLGTHKSPAVYGAFPIDPYSHTPSFAGAQQPGMTGQVKEDLLSRFAELGASVRCGKLRFSPSFALRSETVREERDFRYIDVASEERSIRIEPGCYAFTICQVPVVAHSSEHWAGPPRIFIERPNGESEILEGLELDEEESRRIFDRDSTTRRLDVYYGGGYDGSGKASDGQ